MIISGQICGSKLQKVFTLGDGCWLPTLIAVALAAIPHMLRCRSMNALTLLWDPYVKCFTVVVVNNPLATIPHQQGHLEHETVYNDKLRNTCRTTTTATLPQTITSTRRVQDNKQEHDDIHKSVSKNLNRKIGKG